MASRLPQSAQNGPEMVMMTVVAMKNNQKQNQGEPKKTKKKAEENESDNQGDSKAKQRSTSKRTKENQREPNKKQMRTKRGTREHLLYILSLGSIKENQI